MNSQYSELFCENAEAGCFHEMIKCTGEAPFTLLTGHNSSVNVLQVLNFQSADWTD